MVPWRAVDCGSEVPEDFTTKRRDRGPAPRPPRRKLQKVHKCPSLCRAFSHYRCDAIRSESEQNNSTPGRFEISLREKSMNSIDLLAPFGRQWRRYGRHAGFHQFQEFQADSLSRIQWYDSDMHQSPHQYAAISTGFAISAIAPCAASFTIEDAGFRPTAKKQQRGYLPRNSGRIPSASHLTACT